MKRLYLTFMLLVLMFFLIQPAFAALTQLTTDAANERTPSWSPDGQSIVYSKDAANDGSDLYIISARGGEPIQLTTGHCDFDPAWSPDGTKIAFCRTLEVDPWRSYLATIPAQGGAVTQLTDGSFAAMYPDWRGDGSKIVFMLQDASLITYQIATIASTGGAITMLTDLHASCYTPKYCERDNRIAFSAQYPTMDDNIFVMNEDGGGFRQVTTKQAAEVEPDWVPNGTMIVYSDRSGADDDLYVVPADGPSEGKQITNFPADERNPAWSPVGTKLAFESDRMGNCDIWVLDNVWLKVEPATVGMIKATYK